MNRPITRRNLMLSALGLSIYLASGCGGGGGSDDNNTGTTEPAPTNLDRSTSVAGPDTDNDGVRDDIAALIDQYPLSNTENEAFKSVARTLQSALLNAGSKDASVNNAQVMFTAISRFNNFDIDASYYLNRVLAYTLNTPERTAAYLAFEANLNGLVLRPTFSVSATPQSRQVDVCTSSGFSCGYINGVLTPHPKAQLSLDLIHSQIGETFNGEAIEYELMHNPTDQLEDFIEVAKQKFTELGITYALELAWAILLGDDGLVDTISSVLSRIHPEVGRLVSELRQVVIQISSSVQSIGPNPEPVISGFTSAVNVNITERKKVLLIAHSQGNLFANAVYDRVVPGLETNSLAVVHVATPASSVRGAYTTSFSDLVIQAVPTAMPSNIAILPTLTDWLGHGLAETYLNPRLAAQAKIKADVMTALGSLVAPTQGGTAGFFTITLTWDGPGDVDLHVIEPNGNHVYYASKQGRSGYLDIDNTVANGPEHYYASCQSEVLQAGVYEIGINNYVRATGRIASVALATQDRIYEPITLGVGEERGSSGDELPIFVLSVRVEVDSTGRYKASLLSSRSLRETPRKLRTYAVPTAPKR